MEIPIQPKHEGIATGRVFIPGNDPMEMDDVRYFTLQVGPPPEALIVCDRTTDQTY